MTVTLTWEGIILTLLAAAGIVFLIYLSLLMKKLMGNKKLQANMLNKLGM